MGIDIGKCEFTEESYERYQKKLNQNVAALESLIKREGFGKLKHNSKVLGAELEMYIVNKQGRPVMLNEELRQLAEDPQLTLEINRYNLEYNLTPYSFAELPFESTEKEILQQVRKLNELAGKFDANVLPIGILPTLSKSDFGKDWMTDRERYHVLVDQLFKQRGRNFEIHINGVPPLKMEMSDVTLEGANTSFQIHYRVEPSRYAKVFNALQLVTPLAIAIGANSPGLFGHELWSETRIPLFKQSIDTRIKDRYSWHEPSRVCFGQGWVRDSALELFKETSSIYQPLLPITDDDDPLGDVSNGRTPKLSELRLHQSTVWLWNRPVYDDQDGGHFRVELRALPAGPTAVDMVANAAFYIGLAEYYADNIDALLPSLPFYYCEYNFYRAAQSGLAAKIIWPEQERCGCREFSILDLLKESTDKAADGLKKIGVSALEIERYISVIRDRIDSRQTGSTWQSQRMKYHSNNGIDTIEECAQVMLQEYMQFSLSNLPVSEWPQNW